MESIEQMIKNLCPDGIKFVKLGEVGKFYGGLSGKSKNDFVDGNAKFITYMNVYSNPSLAVDVKDKVVIKEGERQNTIQYGDILFTGSSETPDECGMSSVLTTYVEEDLYLNSFCFGYRFDDLTDINPHFLKHLFRSASLRKAIAKTANGVTRFNVSKKLFAEIEIPLPPIEIQNRIVEVLDKMTTLTAELEAELEARKQQYEYYRNKLLTFNEIGGGKQVVWKKISEIAHYPKARIKSEMLTVDTYVGVESLVKNRGGKTSSSAVPEGSAIEFLPQDILIGNIRPYLKKIWLSDCKGGTNGDVVCIRVHDSKEVMPKFLYYILASDAFFDYDNSHAKGGKMPRGDKNAILSYTIPVPSMEEQERIVSILDRFEALTTDLQIGLPAEIEARRQQYEYYRNKLLTFNKVA